jgi:hypothetical protein
VWGEKKRLEKLNYGHGNAMKKGSSQLSLLISGHSSLATALLHSDSWLLTSAFLLVTCHSSLATAFGCPFAGIVSRVTEKPHGTEIWRGHPGGCRHLIWNRSR